MSNRSRGPARAGSRAKKPCGRGLVRGLPNGLPEPVIAGSTTRTPGAARIGAALLFCLLADLEIRERTRGRKSLDDALRAILFRGGDISVRWDLSRALEEGDRATGTSVLTDLHRRMGSQSFEVDLTRLWKKLGVELRGDAVTFDDDAALSHVRRALTEGR